MTTRTRCLYLGLLALLVLFGTGGASAQQPAAAGRDGCAGNTRNGVCGLMPGTDLQVTCPTALDVQAQRPTRVDLACRVARASPTPTPPVFPSPTLPPSPTPTAVPAGLVTPELVGSPLAAYYPNAHMARNLWDLQAWQGRLYLGNGDSALNTGPAPVVYYDLGTGQFGDEGTVPDEAIDHFAILNETTLAAPGDDDRFNDNVANWYTREAGGWTLHHNLPAGLHTFDLHTYAGQLFASYATADHAPLLSSSDNGATWLSQDTNNWSADAFFELGGSLYVQTFPDTEQPGPYSNWYRYDLASGQWVPAPGEMFPGADLGYVPEMRNNPVLWQGALVYVGSYTANVDGFGLWTATALGQARPIALPGAARVRAVRLATVQGTPAVVALAATRQADGSYRNAVYRSTDLATWTELFYFPTTPTAGATLFARSFEYANGAFYFGLGGYGLRTNGSTSVLFDGGSWNENGVDPAVGNLLRVRY